MVQTYNILGRQVKSQYLALSVMGVFGGLVYSFTGGSSKAAQVGPPINASNKDEQNFIQDFLREAEKKKADDARKVAH